MTVETKFHIGQTVWCAVQGVWNKTKCPACIKGKIKLCGKQYECPACHGTCIKHYNTFGPVSMKINTVSVCISERAKRRLNYKPDDEIKITYSNAHNKAIEGECFKTKGEAEARARVLDAKLKQDPWYQVGTNFAKGVTP